MSDVNRWRVELAHRIATLYATNPDVEAILLTGGVARGSGDAFSDVDIAVFWKRLPSSEERKQGQAAIGQLLNMALTQSPLMIAARPDEITTMLMERVWLGGDEATGFKIDITHMTVAGVQQLLNDLLEQHDTSKLEWAYSLLHSIILYGETVAQSWQQQLECYPDELAHKVVWQHLTKLWLLPTMELAFKRKHWHKFYEATLKLYDHILNIIYALNHQFNPGELDSFGLYSASFTIKPDNLDERLEQTFNLSPIDILTDSERLVKETLALIETHMPTVDLWVAHYLLKQRRQQFSQSILDNN
jgi:predicted nucleotidyltransferase